MAFYLNFERRMPDGRKTSIRASDRCSPEGRVPDWNRVRYEMLSGTRLFRHRIVSEHFCEYVPWFIKRDRPDLIEEFNIPLDEYIRRCEDQIARWDDCGRRNDGQHQIEVERSNEYAAGIILAKRPASRA